MPPKRSTLTKQGLIKCRHWAFKRRLTSDDATEQSLINLKYQKLPDEQFELANTESRTNLTSLQECHGHGRPRGGRGSGQGHPCQECGVPQVPNGTGGDRRGRGGHRLGGGRGGGDQRGAVGGACDGKGRGCGGGGGGGGRRGGGGGGRRGEPGRGGGRVGRGG